MRKLLAAALFATFSVNANATPITFELSSSASEASFFSVANFDITLSFSNANLDGKFDSDSDGLVILDATGFSFPAISAFELSFDENVRLISYDIGFLNDYGDESFTIIGANGSTTELGPFALGARNFDTSFTVTAGEALMFAVDPGPGLDGIIQMYSITVMPVVPLPATAWLLLSALGGLGWIRRRTA